MENFISIIINKSGLNEDRDIVLDTVVNTANIGLLESTMEYEIYESEDNTQVLTVPIIQQLNEKQQASFAKKLANKLFDKGYTDFDIEFSINEATINEADPQAVAAVARVSATSRNKIGTDAGDGLVWIVGNANALTRTRPNDPRVAAQKAAAAQPATTQPAAGNTQTTAPAQSGPLRRGSKGPAVRKLQLDLGVQPADGDFGPATEAAVKDFQQRYQLKADGVVGPETAQQIERSVSIDTGDNPPLAKSDPNSQFAALSDFGTSRRGGLANNPSQVDAIKELQAELKRRGLLDGEVDGKYGPQTRAAVRAFQEQNDLYVDGDAGPKTIQLLMQRDDEITMTPLDDPQDQDASNEPPGFGRSQDRPDGDNPAGSMPDDELVGMASDAIDGAEEPAGGLRDLLSAREVWDEIKAMRDEQPKPSPERTRLNRLMNSINKSTTTPEEAAEILAQAKQDSNATDVQEPAADENNRIEGPVPADVANQITQMQQDGDFAGILALVDQYESLYTAFNNRVRDGSNPPETVYAYLQRMANQETTAEPEAEPSGVAVGDVATQEQSDTLKAIDPNNYPVPGEELNQADVDALNDSDTAEPEITGSGRGDGAAEVAQRRADAEEPAEEFDATPIARNIYNAMKGLGTDEQAVYDAIKETGNAENWAQIVDKYPTVYVHIYRDFGGRDLRKVKSELEKIGVTDMPKSRSVAEYEARRELRRRKNESVESSSNNSSITESKIQEVTFDDDDKFFEEYGVMWFNEDDTIDEAEYQGRKVKLGKPMAGDVKKFKVYVKNPKGNVVKVNFGQKGAKIKKSNPDRRRSFRARHNCDNPGPRHKARYWSCRKW